MKKSNIKWILIVLLVVTIHISIGYSLFKGSSANTENTSIETQRKALLEVAHTYYRQGVQHQYDSYKKNLYSTPEDATSQHYTYTVCSGFTFQVYYQTFGIRIPDTTEELLDYAEENKNNTDTVIAFYKGSDLIYSKDVLGTSTTSNYSNLANEWVDILKPGDVIVVTGHAMLVDSIDTENRKVNLIESGAGGRYNFTNHIDNYDESGTIQYRSLTTKFKQYYNRINNDGTLLERIAVIRFITDGESYINTDNEKDTYTLTDSALSRLKYPEIDIEKIVKVHEADKTISQNILTNLGESITYELTIKNNSDTDYNSFNVIENIDSKTTVTDVGTGTLSNNQIKWTISSLKANKSITLSYTVKVNNDKSLLGKIIVSTGYVDNIATSRIETLIGNKLNTEEKEILSTTYEKLKNNNQVEREFINQLYIDAFNLDIGLTGLSNLDIISFDTSITTGGKDTLSVKSTKVNDTKVKKYIYNNFYGLRIGQANDSKNSIVRAILQWNIYSTYETNDRARTLTEDMLNEGDIILVYLGKNDTTDTNLVNKSYIYLNNKLIRKLSSTEFEELSGDELTVFLRNIIGDNYIILRPSIAMIENTSEEINYTLNFNSDLTIDKTNKYIKYLNTNTTVTELLNKVEITGGTINIYDKNNNKKNTNDKLATGDKLITSTNNETKDEYTISILGDSNGDNSVGLIDLVQLRKHIVGYVNPETSITEKKTGVYYYALDLNQDNNINLIDLAKMRRKIVGLDE